MDVADLPLTAAARTAAAIVALLLLALAVRRAPWLRLAGGPSAAVLCGGVFVLCALWMLRAAIATGPAFHLLGSAALALLLGGPLALVGGAAVVAIVTLLRDAAWSNAGVVWLTAVAVPVAVVGGVRTFAERRLPPNFFVYVFGICFGGTVLAYLASGLAAGIAAVGSGPLALDDMASDYAPYLLPLAFGEALLTGMALTLAVVYRPAWVATFDDVRYLRRE